VLNDTNGHLVNLFTVIREQGEALALEIEMTPWSEAEYERFEHALDEGDALERARRFLVRCWQAHGGTLASSSGWKHNGLGGRAYPVRLWQQLPQRLLAVIERLRDAEIRSRPALELIPYYRHPSVLIYADPPYVRKTRSRDYYPDEMTDEEHVQLLATLELHPGPVVLSGYSHPLYKERLAHWQRLEMLAVAEHGKHCMEVLWLNRKVVNQGQLWMFDSGEGPSREAENLPFL
jgi:DNA adenine methylase